MTTTLANRELHDAVNELCCLTAYQTDIVSLSKSQIETKLK